MPFDVWPAPSARAFSRASLTSLRQRIRPRGTAPAKPNLDTGFGDVVSGQQLTRAWLVVGITGAGAGLRRSGRGGVADVGRHDDASGLEQGTDHTGGGRAQRHPPPILGDLDLLQPVEIKQHIAPLRPEGFVSARAKSVDERWRPSSTYAASRMA